MNRTKTFLSLMAFLGGMSLLAQVPPVPAPGGELFPEFAPADTAAAQALFTPMRGSLPVTLERAGERPWVRLPVNFAGTAHDRASWDIRITADLAAAQGIEFDFFSSDSSPVSGFAVYFRSGGGWYRAGFAVERDGEWQRVTIDKSATSTEGAPAGWAQVDTIRLSAWRGAARDTFCGIANLRPVGADAAILVVRADSCAGPDNPESRGYAQYAETVASCLADLGLGHALLSDLDLTAARLQGRKLVILPYNPRLPEGALAVLRDFVEQGGKVVSFYSLAEGIPELLGMGRGRWVQAEGGRYQGFSKVGEGLDGQPDFVGQASWAAQPAAPVPGSSRTVAVWRGADGRDTEVPAIVVSERGAHVSHVWLKDDWDNKRTLMLALVAGTVPDVWRQAAETAYAGIGVFGGFGNVAELVAELGETALREGLEQREQARALLGNHQYRAALDRSQQAAQSLLRAWCASRPAQANEFRGFWCHNAFGIPGKSWDEAIKQLADSGFTAILPNLVWGGVAFYPSQVLPEYPELATRGGQLAECLAACRRHGVECHVWKVNWNMGRHTSQEFVDRMREAGRVQVSVTGEVQERWLCPSHPENQALEVASMVEIARNYDVDGVHFDYIRYPGLSHCFCAGCRERFEERLGQPVANWPGDASRGGALNRQWLDFRRSNIDTVVRQVAEQVRQVRPGVKISAAVFANWPVDRDGIGQDWKLWCDEGWLDFLNPMNYTESNATFRHQTAAQLDYAGRVPVYPGIGLSVWRDPQDAVKLIEQIEISRQLGTGGFTIFEYNARMEGVLPLVSLGTTATR